MFGIKGECPLNTFANASAAYTCDGKCNAALFARSGEGAKSCECMESFVPEVRADGIYSSTCGPGYFESLGACDPCPKGTVKDVQGTEEMLCEAEEVNTILMSAASGVAAIMLLMLAAVILANRTGSMLTAMRVFFSPLAMNTLSMALDVGDFLSDVFSCKNIVGSSEPKVIPYKSAYIVLTAISGISFALCIAERVLNLRWQWKRAEKTIGSNSKYASFGQMIRKSAVSPFEENNPSGAPARTVSMRPIAKLKLDAEEIHLDIWANYARVLSLLTEDIPMLVLNLFLALVVKVDEDLLVISLCITCYVAGLKVRSAIFIPSQWQKREKLDRALARRRNEMAELNEVPSANLTRE